MKQKNIVVANDLGYGNLKMTVDDERILQPTVISPIEQDIEDAIDHTDQNAVRNTIHNLLNEMNVEIDGKHYLVGKAAQNSTIDRISTDLNSRSRKAHMPAAKMVPLSTIAAKVVQHAYEEGEDIFSPLTANVVMATSLPIEDIENNPADREFYRGLFINNNHIIVFKNFDYKISVTINFKDVQVYKEGEVAAAIAIKYADENLKKYIKGYLNKKYPTIDKTKLLNGSNKDSLAIDVGFETTEFSLIINGKSDAFNSLSISNGYGDVLSSAWRYLPKVSQGYTVKDVIAFEKLLNSQPSSEIEEENKEFALKAESTATPSLIRNIISSFHRIVSPTDNLDVIYVFGGGSIPLMEKTDFEKQLKNSLKTYRSSATIVWLGEDYSSIANELGLEILAKALDKSLNKK